LIGIAFLGSSQWSIRSAQCGVSFRARAEKRERSVANVEFRSRGAAVDVDQICFGLAPAPSFLRAICSIPLFGIAKFAAIVSISRCQQKYQQIGRLEQIFYQCFPTSLRKFSQEHGIEPTI